MKRRRRAIRLAPFVAFATPLQQLNIMKKLFRKLGEGIKKIISQLKDKTNILIFILTFLVLSSEVWVMYLLYFITGNAWFLGIGSICWSFWFAPFTPFIPLCLAITIAIRKIYDKIRGRKSHSRVEKK